MEVKFKFRDLNISLAPVAHLAKKSPGAFNKASKVGVVQFLTWCNTGSKGSSKKPPIRWGVLRGSGSGFVGNELVAIFEIPIKAGSPEQATPARSHVAAPTTMTWCWNTDYAAKMHEWTGGWGQFTIDDGNAGSQWLAEHLRTDAQALYDVIGMEFRQVVGL